MLESPAELFQRRCEQDPQGVIKDLVAQTGRQGAELNKLIEENKSLKKQVESLLISTAPF